MPLVTTAGFKPAELPPGIATSSLDNPARANRLDLDPDTDVASILDRLDSAKLITIAFPSFADGRGFSLAQRLRHAGYKGHLRAVGHVISDQFRYALDCGFDDVEITDALAERQPEGDWISNQLPLRSYRERLRGLTTLSSSQAGRSDDQTQSQLRLNLSLAFSSSALRTLSTTPTVFSAFASRVQPVFGTDLVSLR